MNTTKLAKASSVQTRTGVRSSSIEPVHVNTVVSGYHPSRPVDITFSEKQYKETAARCRWYYMYDPIARTVINRMVDLALTRLTNTQNRLNKKPVDKKIMAFYNKLADDLLPILKSIAIEYLVTGMAIPDYVFTDRAGKDISEALMPRVYRFPVVWVRDIEHITLEKRPISEKRVVYLEIPPEDISFVETKGLYADGKEDKEGYNELVALYPEYVRAIQRGVRHIIIDVDPILLNTSSHTPYPFPYLMGALRPLEHKDHLRSLDRSVAARAIEAIRHIKIGNDEYPASEDDINDHKASLVQSTSSYDQVYNWVTNHTVTAQWIIPPLDTLLNDSKYLEVNADIFIGFGFPRVLTAGETLRSNSSDSSIAALGPKSTLEGMQRIILHWVEKLYKEVALENGFIRYPKPNLPQVSITDFTALVQFAIDAMREGAISKNRVAELYGSDYETERFYMQQEPFTESPSFKQTKDIQKQEPQQDPQQDPQQQDQPEDQPEDQQSPQENPPEDT